MVWFGGPAQHRSCVDGVGAKVEGERGHNIYMVE
ncbi:hypothetical protein PVAP13_9KG339132 [Panicum virgatum]|uniref:Uncharacterized protein n=1 Tax=Panicum virgatum TaxID=38727 RepID=A0A8T0NTE5_PANVG|nr:hypothetical protein PVAP13_9KG339132 [Panicum virgatum]